MYIFLHSHGHLCSAHLRHIIYRVRREFYPYSEIFLHKDREKQDSKEQLKFLLPWEVARSAFIPPATCYLKVERNIEK